MSNWIIHVKEKTEWLSSSNHFKKQICCTCMIENKIKEDCLLEEKRYQYNSSYSFVYKTSITYITVSSQFTPSILIIFSIWARNGLGLSYPKAHLFTDSCLVEIAVLAGPLLLLKTNLIHKLRMVGKHQTYSLTHITCGLFFF